MPPNVPQHERQEVLRVRVLGVELGGAGERLERFLVEAAIVEHLTQVEVQHAAVRVELARALEPLSGLLDRSTALLRQAQLHQHGDVVGRAREHRLELFDRQVVLAQ